jgi:hypothetical protein
MHPVSDIWLIWTLAALVLVGIHGLHGRWHSRQRAEEEAKRKADRGCQLLLDDLVVGNATIEEDSQFGVYIVADSEAAAASALYDRFCRPVRNVA